MEEPDDGSIAMEPTQEQKTESYENYSKDNVPEHNQELPIIPLTSTENKEPIADHLDEEDNKKILLETEPIDIVLEEGTVEQLNDGKMAENSSNMELKLGKHEIMDNDEMKSEHEETTPDLDDLDNDAPDTPFTIDDLTDITIQEGKESGELEGEQKLIRPRLVNPTELSCCEYCQGPVKKRRLCSPLKKFCSKACARNCRKAKKEDEGQDGQTEESAGGEGDFKMTWDDYLRAASSKAAPESCFKHTTTDVPGLKPGMKLEAVDRNNPPSYCVATVIKCVGHRVCIRYDGYGSDSSNDIWCNFQAEELHPIGWCAQNGYPLQPPKGVGSSLEAWRTFLTQTLTGALAAPQDLFKKSQEHFQPRVHGFEVGMKLEAIHPLRPSIICPATVTKSLGPYYFAVTPDFQHDLPPTTFCCHSDSPGIFPVGWCYRNGIELTYPANYTKKTFSWQKYLSVCRALAAPSQLFKKVKAHKFKVGMKVEAVDIEQPSVICVATITNVIGRLLLLFFDGRSRFQFVDVESPDLYPIGWCKRTGHPLDTPFGVMPATLDAKAKSVEQEVLYLPSFDEVMGRQVPQTLQNQSHLALSSRKPTTRPDQEKDKEKDKDKEREDNHGDFESEEKSGESDMSEDDCLASERFYHNKNQIFFNKGCCIGPLLNPERVKLLPDATPPGKVSTVIRTGLEMVAKAALDPEKVIDLMQEGCGVRVTIKHEGKLLKKAISRVDSRPKLERYLKRFCRRLICCEYFLSLKPVGQPCPDQCKADDQGNLQGPKGLKAKRSREYFEVKHLGFEKKKRGRRKKVDILSDASSSTAVKKTMIENGASGSVAPVISTSSNRQLAPAYHLPHNGNVIPRPVTTSTLPGVQAPVVRYQGPGNVAVVRPNTNLHMGGRVSGTAIATAHSPHIVAAATVQGNTKVVKQDGVLPQSRIIMADPVSPGPNKARIVTNISGQTFATSSSGSGTTITFGRAPPNVTVSSSAVPPPLTRISNTVESISVPTEKGGIGPTTSPLMQAAVTPKSSGVLSLAAVSHAAHPRGPPNVVVSASQGMMTTSGGTVQVSVSDTSTGLYTSSSTPVSGVIRAPIVVPPQVKQETPPPPPLVHASKVSPGLRMVGASGVVSSNVTLSTSSFSHPRSLPQKVYPSAPLGESRSPHSTYTNTGHLVSPSVPGQTSRTLYIRSNTPAKSVTAVTSNKHLMPRYQSFAQRISPKPQTAIQAGSIRIIQDVVKPQSPVFSPIGQTSRPIMAKPGVIQTIHHNPVSIAPSSSPVKPRAGPLPTSQSFVHSTTLEKIRAGIKPSLGHVERASEEKNKPSNSHEEGNKEKDELGMKDKDIGEEQGDGKDEQPKKRNLWWLKKRKRKRSRLTYMKTKYRKKDDGTGGDESGVKEESHPDFSDYQDELGSPDRPKRGRMNELNDIVLAFEEDGDGLPPMIDEEDPDWDESAERRKAKQNMRTKKRGFGRNRKDGETDLSPTLSNPPSPFSPTSLHSPLSLCTGSKQLPNDNKSLIMKLDPAPSRRPVTVAMDHRNDLGPKVKSPRSASYSTPDAHGPGHHSTGYPSRTIRSTSSRTSPLSPKSPSFNRQSVPKRVVDVGVNTSLPGCLNVRSPELPSNPVTWTVDDVITYVRSTDCSHYAPIFQEEEIDGQALLMLSRDALMQFTPMKLGPTLKMCSYISQLRLRAK